MPYRLVAHSARCKGGWAVENAQTGRVMGCHKTRSAALAQLAALHIHVDEAVDKDTNERRTGDVSYRAAHYRVESKRGKPRKCSRCGRSGGAAKDYAWAHTGGSREDVSNYTRLCVTCHNRLDGPKHAKAITKASGEEEPFVNLVADAEVPAMAGALVGLWEALARRITDAMVEDALRSQEGLARLYLTLESPDDDELTKALAPEPRPPSRTPPYSWSRDRTVNTYARITSRSARGTLAQYPEMAPTTRATMEGRLDISSPYVRRAAATQTANQVQQVTWSTKRNIRREIYDAQRLGTPPEEVAANIRRGVGLDQRSRGAVGNYRNELDKVMAGTTDPRTIGPRRYDRRPPAHWTGRWTLAPKPKGTLTASRADQMADEYARKLRTHRARTIARTETIRAANEGQQLTWEEMAHRGALPKDFARRWVTHADERTCGACMSLNGTTVSLRGQFRAEVGRDNVTTRTPPLHPNCRCTVVASTQGRGRRRQGPAFLEGRIFGNKPEMTEAEKKQAIISFLLVNPFDELALAAGGALATRAMTMRALRSIVRPSKPTVFKRLDDLDANLAEYGEYLDPSEYMVHRSGIVDALQLRQATTLELAVTDEAFERLAVVPGFRRVLVDDIPTIRHETLDLEIVQLADANLAPSDLTKVMAIEGRPFVDPETAVAILRQSGTAQPLTVLSTDAFTLFGRIPAARRADVLEDIVRRGGPELERAKARLKLLIVEGRSVERNMRDLSILEGEFLHADDIQGFIKALNKNKYTKEELDALWEYAGLHRQLNDDGVPVIGKGPVRRFHRHLRYPETYGPLPPDLQRVMDLVDQAIAKNRLHRDVTLHRGAALTNEAVDQLRADAAAGRIIRDAAPAYTGLTEARAMPHARNALEGPTTHTQVLFKINAKKGTPAISSPYGHALPGRKVRIGSYGVGPIKVEEVRGSWAKIFNKEEIILQRNQGLRITDSFTREDGVVVFIAETVEEAGGLIGRPRLAELTRYDRLAASLAAIPATGGVAEVRAIEDALKAVYPTSRKGRQDRRVFLAGMNPTAARELADTLGRFERSYPQVFDGLDLVQATRLASEEVGFSLPGLPSSLLFDAEKLSNHEEFLSFAEAEVRRGFWVKVPGVTPMQALVSHEMYHHVEFFLARRLGQEEMERLLDEIISKNVAKYLRLYDLDLDNLAHKARIEKAISRYGAKNMYELGAEMFAASTSASPKVSPLFKAFRRDLDALIEEASGPAPRRVFRPPLPPTPRAIRGEGPPRMSPMVPKAVGSTRHPLGTGPIMDTSTVPDSMVKSLLERQVQVPGFGDLASRLKRAKTPQGRRAILDEVVARQADNLTELAERAWDHSEEAVRQHAKWYPFANKWLKGLARKTKGVITPEAAFAVTAALSPSTDWANNVAWAKRFIEAFADQSKVVVKQEWVDAWNLLEPWERKRNDLVGKTLADLVGYAGADKDTVLVMRAWHAHDPVHQLGGHAGFGKVTNKAPVQSGDNLIKAIKVLRDPTPETIDKVIGGLKVRSFYNNLANPLDRTFLDVTVDTHHFGAANALPWTTSSTFISTERGSINLTERPSHAGTGHAGAFSNVAEATRIATARFNLAHNTDFTPNQFQSIVWERWRSEYPSDFRSPALERQIGKIRNDLIRKRVTPTQARRLVEEARLAAGAPTEAEILEMYRRYDLKDKGRPSWSQLREELRGNP